MNIQQDIAQLLKEVWIGHVVSPSAYDTAWIARLIDLDRDLGTGALKWLRENQLDDGSWGEGSLFYYHDRVICTLSAMIALVQYGQRSIDHRIVEAGQRALERMTTGITRGLAADLGGPTTGFELIVPSLVHEAETAGLMQRRTDGILRRFAQLREAKLKKLHGLKIDRAVSAAFSAEMAGQDNKHLLDIDHLQEANGSLANSPSATAYFALALRPGDERALNYLRRIVSPDGSVPFLAPIELFEGIWVMWNLALVRQESGLDLALYQPAVDVLERQLMADGIGFSAEVTFKDGDDTALACATLYRFNRQVSLQPLFHYEGKTSFLCYHEEASTSTGANIHALDALRCAGYAPDHPTVEKVVRFLRKTAQPFWQDKWHVSPYYATAHAVIVCAGYQNDLATAAVDWILRTQKTDGSWGIVMPTAEETAYCLQALAIWNKHTNSVDKRILRMGTTWLKEHADLQHPPLWIGKSLYRPELLVRSVILSALALTAAVE